MSVMRMAFAAIAGALAGTVCVGLAGGAARAQIVDESLLAPMPPGFQVGWQGTPNGTVMQQWIPEKETMETWSKMASVQLFPGNAGYAPQIFLGALSQRWKMACQETRVTNTEIGQVNGYPAASLRLQCPLVAGTGKPELAMLQSIQGKDSFYLVQRVVRFEPTDDQVAKMLEYMATVTVCDPRSPEHPCPKVKTAP
jgi:hypothetical protein